MQKVIRSFSIQFKFICIVLFTIHIVSKQLYRKCIFLEIMLCVYVFHMHSFDHI